jgi:crotonobetainyl-CoA:carnitine CoA-transferase CaiB-like acyl-CoA transferase
MIVETDHHDYGTVRQVNSAVRVGAARVDHRRAPRPNEDAADVLGGLLGYDADRIARLTNERAFGA